MSEVSASPQSRAGADRGAAVLGGPLPPPPSRQGSCPLPGARRMEGRAEVASHALQGPALASRLTPHLPSATPAADPVAPVGTCCWAFALPLPSTWNVRLDRLGLVPGLVRSVHLCSSVPHPQPGRNRSGPLGCLPCLHLLLASQHVTHELLPGHPLPLEHVLHAPGPGLAMPGPQDASDCLSGRGSGRPGLGSHGRDSSAFVS